jgi:esterase/lipase superfamily enzyme
VAEKVKNNLRKVVMAGCSFGGYHAANFAFRHPGYVSHLFPWAKTFDIKETFLDGFHIMTCFIMY